MLSASDWVADIAEDSARAVPSAPSGAVDQAGAAWWAKEPGAEGLGTGALEVGRGLQMSGGGWSSRRLLLGNSLTDSRPRVSPRTNPCLSRGLPRALGLTASCQRSQGTSARSDTRSGPFPGGRALGPRRVVRSWGCAKTIKYNGDLRTVNSGLC